MKDYIKPLKRIDFSSFTIDTNIGTLVFGLGLGSPITHLDTKFQNFDSDIFLYAFTFIL